MRRCRKAVRPIAVALIVLGCLATQTACGSGGDSPDPDDPEETGSPLPVLDPGRDPEFETQRRNRPIGFTSLVIGLTGLFAALLAVWLLHRRHHPLLSRFLLLASSLVFTLVLVEAVLLLTSDVWTIHVKIRSNCYHTNPRNYFKLSRMARHPEIHAWCVDPIDRVWDECERPKQESRPEALRVLALGDSFTNGVGVFTEDTWPARLQIYLDHILQSETPTQVVNCGRADHFSVDVALRFQDYKEVHRPDVVVYAFVLNDVPPPQLDAVEEPADISFQFENSPAYLNRMDRDPLMGPWTRNSAIARFFAERYITRRIAIATEQMYQAAFTDRNRLNLLTALDAVESMQTDCRIHDRRYLVAIFPMFYNLDDYPLKSAHILLTRELEERGIEVLDLLSVYEGLRDEDLQVHPTDFHPNEHAQRMAAEAIGNRLVDLGWTSRNQTR